MTGEPIAVLPTRAIEYKAVTRPRYSGSDASLDRGVAGGQEDDAGHADQHARGDRGSQGGSHRDEADGDRVAERGLDQPGHSPCGTIGPRQAAVTARRPGRLSASCMVLVPWNAFSRAAGRLTSNSTSCVPTSAIISSGRIIARHASGVAQVPRSTQPIPIRADQHRRDGRPGDPGRSLSSGSSLEPGFPKMVVIPCAAKDLAESVP